MAVATRAVARGLHDRTLPVPGHVAAAAAVSVALLPVLVPTGPGNSSPVDVAIGLCIVVTLLWAARSRASLHVPYGLPMATLIAAGAIAGLAGPFPGLSLLQLGQDVVLLAWCAALASVARTPQAMSVIVRAWGLSAVVWAAVLVGAYVAGIDLLAGVTAREGARASLLLGDPNLAATYFCVSILVLGASGVLASRLLRWPAYLLLVAALVLTGSNGGLIGLSAGLAVTLLVHVARRSGMVPAVAFTGAILVAAVAIAATVPVDGVQRAARDSGVPLLRDSIGRSDASVQQRQTLIGESAGLLFQGGLLGWGPRSTKAVLTTQQAAYQKEAHDDYIAAVVERGILGGVGLVMLICAIAFRVRAVLRSPPPPAFRRAVPHTAPLVGGVAAVAVLATNEQVLHFRHVWALLAIVAAYQLWVAE